jgi:hypothetical protein
MSRPVFNCGKFAGIKPHEFKRLKLCPDSNSIEFGGIKPISTIRPIL